MRTARSKRLPQAALPPIVGSYPEGILSAVELFANPWFDELKETYGDVFQWPVEKLDRKANALYIEALQFRQACLLKSTIERRQRRPRPAN